MAHSCHGYDLVLRRHLLALHHLLDCVRFVAAVVLDRLGIVSSEGEMLPGEPWSELVDTAPMERLMEAAFWQPSSPQKVNRSSSWTAPQYRRRRVAPADVEGAEEDDDGCVGICAICLAALDVGGQLVTELCNCSHAFHAACIDSWIGSGEAGTCPMCRTPTVSTAWWNGWREVVPRTSLSP